jgi:hypothetical protein
MARKNPHIGSSFESWLNEEGIREEVTAAAIKAVIARQLANQMKQKENHQTADGSVDENKRSNTAPSCRNWIALFRLQ